MPTKQRARLDYEISISPISNDMLSFWTKEGYAVEDNSLVKKTIEKRFKKIVKYKRIKKITPIRDMEVSKFRRGDSVVATIDVFGRNKVDKATHLVLYPSKSKIRLRKSDRRAETTRFGFVKGQIIQGYLGMEREFERKIYEKVEVVDQIPISEISYSTFVKGNYKNKKTGKKERGVKVIGEKNVRMGTRAPKDASPTFWADLYKKLKESLIEEFFDDGFSQAGWDADDDFKSEVKSEPEVGGNFPKDAKSYGDFLP